MRVTLCAVLLVFLAGATVFSHPTCEKDIPEELERERKVDADSHGCRACKRIEVEAAPNCPKMGYDCDESLQLTSTPLDSCDCAELRCAAANATLAVDQELVKKVRCKNRKWVSKTGEAESAVCARQCGLDICPAFRVLTPEEAVLGEPLVVNPPDSDHPCGWAECQSGAYMVDGVEHPQQEAASVACTGDATWKFSGTEGETRNVKMAYCVKKQEGCPLLEELSIATCMTLPLGNNVRCYAATRDEKTVTCTGGTPSTYLVLYAKDSTAPETSLALMEVRCNAEARTWEFYDNSSKTWMSQAETEQALQGSPITIACADIS